MNPQISNLDISEESRRALVAQLMKLHQGIQRQKKSCWQDQINAGNILIQLRDTAPHGTWETQLKELTKATGISRSSAHNYMNAVEKGAVPRINDGETIRGYPLDVIRHIFQTSIRQGDEKRAMQVAVELDLSGSTEWMWKRMHVIASEDIGLAEIGLHAEIENLFLQWKRKKSDKMFNSHRIFLVHAVLLLVRAIKSRLVDHALITYYRSHEPIQIMESDLNVPDDQPPIEITNDDLDKHTKAGRKMGRRQTTTKGINHFWEHASVLVNETSQPELKDDYRESARQALLAETKDAKAA